MHNLFYVIGLVVVVLAIINFIAYPTGKRDRTARSIPWQEDRLVVDTSIDEIKNCAAKIAEEMEKLKSSGK